LARFQYMDIQEHLFSMRDEKYASFQAKLIPTVAPESIIGVRTPLLREMAKTMLKDGTSDTFIAVLPHRFFEENQLHAFILSLIKDFEVCLCEVERFLPYVDNWATCDQMSPRCFSKNKARLLDSVRRWIVSRHEYSVRFAINMLMTHFLDDDFRVEYNDIVAGVRREEYYVQMMQAWYFATALAKQYGNTLPYLEKRCLNKWTHNKTIQKALESYRVGVEQKEYLKTLRWK